MATTRIAAGIAVVVLVAGTQSVPAQSPCPKEARAGKSLELASANGRKNVVTWLASDRVRIAEQNPAVPRNFPRITLTLRGLLSVEVAGPGGNADIDYGKAGDNIFPLKTGQQHEIEYTSRIEGGTPLKARMGLAVVEAVQHRIGACNFDALLVVRFSEFEDGRRTPLRYDVYVPQLQAVLKSTLFDEERNAIIEGETFEFETIVEK